MPLRPLLLSLLFALLAAGCAPRGGSGSDDDDSAGDDDDATSSNPTVRVETSLGAFDVEVFAEESPITAQNFLTYVDDGFFDGGDGLGETIFHRVISGFVAQGGGFTPSVVAKDTRPPIVNEAINNGLSNVRGTLSMARTSAPDSATSQFFVNLEDNLFLDPGGNSVEGYAVFAEVVAGMDVVDIIGETPTDSTDKPVVDVVMESVTRL